MGMTAAVVGGALLGLGVSALTGKNKAPNVSGMNADFASAVAEMPRAPETPIVADASGQKTESMLAAEEEEKKKRLAEAEANKTNHTSGLGVTSAANIGRKTLLG